MSEGATDPNCLSGSQHCAGSTGQGAPQVRHTRNETPVTLLTCPWEPFARALS